MLQARLAVGDSLIMVGDCYSPPLYYHVQQEFGESPGVSLANNDYNNYKFISTSHE